MNARVMLEPDKLEATIRQVAARIVARFPGSGLAKLADALVKIADEAVERGKDIKAPHWRLRIVSVVGLAVLVLVLVIVVHSAKPPDYPVAAVELAQGVDAALSILILFGAALAFVVTLEVRSKRKRALEALHELRVLAHVIDLHQLAKDPGRDQIGAPKIDACEPALPGELFTADDLNAYLNECSDLLALIGKVAAWYVQGFHDSVVLRTVNEIEDLTNGLSRKIWQKLTLLERMTGGKSGG
jgi:hypothetical protein